MSAANFEEQYKDLLDTLESEQRERVVQSIANAIDKGWEPTRYQIERQVRARREGWDVTRFLTELGFGTK